MADKMEEVARGKLTDALLTAARDPARCAHAPAVAAEIMRAVLDAHAPSQRAAKTRSLVYNLKHNTELRESVLRRDITAEKLATLSPNELATEQQRQQRLASSDRYYAKRQLGSSTERVVGWNAGTTGKLFGECGAQEGAPNPLVGAASSQRSLDESDSFDDKYANGVAGDMGVDDDIILQEDDFLPASARHVTGAPASPPFEEAAAAENDPSSPASVALGSPQGGGGGGNDDANNSAPAWLSAGSRAARADGNGTAATNEAQLAPVAEAGIDSPTSLINDAEEVSSRHIYSPLRTPSPNSSEDAFLPDAADRRPSDSQLAHIATVMLPPKSTAVKHKSLKRTLDDLRVDTARIRQAIAAPRVPVSKNIIDGALKRVATIAEGARVRVKSFAG